jgi:acetyl-CoA carboxylase carboxyl transferase subunit beta
MGWFSKKKPSEAPPAPKEEIWVQCPACTAHIFKEEWDKNLRVCSRCNYHERLTAQERIDLLIDAGTFDEMNAQIRPADPLGFVDGKGSYADKIEETIAKTGLNESVVTGMGRLNKIKVVLAVMDFRFLGGSLGGGTGDKILQAARYARAHELPCIIVSASGGARMHEGIISLMQMAKTCAGIARLHAAGIPYISVLTDPTTGGVSASYAMVGDVNIAEPGALIGFAGRRVIEETIKQKLPDDFQKAEYLLNHGFLDCIVARKDMKDLLSRILQYSGR